MPIETVFGRFNLTKWQMGILATGLMEGIDFIDELVEVFNLFTKKDINIRPIMEGMCSTPKQYIENFQKEMDIAGIDKAVMLDLPTNPDYEPFENLPKSMTSFLGMNQFNTMFLSSIKPPGIKLYPAMTGGIVEDYRETWVIAEKLGIPITLHCSPGGIGDHEDLSYPNNWAQFIYQYEVNVNFAHGGGNSFNWIDSISTIALESDRDNVYIDTAFHDAAFFDTARYFNDLRKIMENVNVLFGSDWPLCGIYYSYKDLIDKYRENLEPWQFEQITNYNPKMFLKE